MPVNPLFERVMETSTTTGTGTLTLAGAVTGYQSFAVVGDGNTCTFVIEAVDANGFPSGDWERVTGTYTSAGTTLSRTTVVSSSNAGAAVNFGAGTKRVFIAPSPTDDSLVSTLTETAESSAFTAAWGNYYVCSGTTYTITGTTASGNAGKVIAIRVTASGTLTFDPASSETVGGRTTFALLSGDFIVLVSDGTNIQIVSLTRQDMAAYASPAFPASPATVATDESTTSTTYVDLATADSVTFTLGAARNLLVIYISGTYTSGDNGNVYSQVYLDGAAQSGSELQQTLPHANYGIAHCIMFLIASVAAGSHTIAIKHHSQTTFTAHWYARTLAVMITG